MLWGSIINNSVLLETPVIAKAFVDGREYNDIPADLFIPPDALEVLLDSFSGPLDLLLYLIRKQNINVLDIPMVSITAQYMVYIDLMAVRKLELAADYLLMAAMLAEIKSRMLLPVSPTSEEEPEEDPRMALVRRLQAYEQIKQVAEALDALPRQGRDTFIAKVQPAEYLVIKAYPEVLLSDVYEALCALAKKAEQFAEHAITPESLSVKDRMSSVLLRLETGGLVTFTQLYDRSEGRMGLIVSFLAILELAKLALVTITQVAAFSMVYLEAV